METRVAFVGFGEAAMAFAGDAAARGYDRKTDDPALRAEKRAEYARLGVQCCDTLAEAVDGATIIVSLVTADQALAVAESAAGLLGPGAYWLDMNSVAPGTKCAAAAAIEARGARYCDVAIMAPVLPLCMAVPMLVSGAHAGDAAAALAAIGFSDVSVVPGGVGAAASIKLIRSVMVKGMEALSAECILAAHAAGVTEAVIASLDASWPGADWARRIDYNLDRMMRHGERRATEMAEAIIMLDDLGTGTAMTRATVDRQRAIGALRLCPHGIMADRLATLRAAL